MGLVALIIGVSAFFQKDDQHLRYYLTVFTLCMAVHFFMLEQYTSTCLALLGSVRNFVSSRTKNVWAMSLFIFIAVSISISNIDSLVHILPSVAIIAGSWGLFREKGIAMRVYMSCGTVCWLSHNLIVGSMGGILIESIFLIANFKTMYSLYRESHV
nr:YgjV family protein [Paraglaciecola sp. L3A3]